MVIKGNFEEALTILIERLVRAKYSNKLAHDLLLDWDQRRGNDWFTSTLMHEENKELAELARLKAKYEDQS